MKSEIYKKNPIYIFFQISKRSKEMSASWGRKFASILSDPVWYYSFLSLMQENKSIIWKIGTSTKKCYFNSFANQFYKLKFS